MCFNDECYNRFTFNNETACHNQNNQCNMYTIACMVNLGSSNSLRVVTKQAIMIVFYVALGSGYVLKAEYVNKKRYFWIKFLWLKKKIERNSAYYFFLLPSNN